MKTCKKNSQCALDPALQPWLCPYLQFLFGYRSSEPNQVKLLIAAPPCLYNYDAVNVLYNRSQIHSSKPPLV